METTVKTPEEAKKAIFEFHISHSESSKGPGNAYLDILLNLLEREGECMIHINGQSLIVKKSSTWAWKRNCVTARNDVM